MFGVSGWFKLATHNMRKADILLTLIGPIISGGLAIILLRRKANREFPFFFSYVIAAILFGLLRAFVANNYRLYFEVFWMTEAIYIVLALLALYEVFR